MRSSRSLEPSQREDHADDDQRHTQRHEQRVGLRPPGGRLDVVRVEPGTYEQAVA